MGRGWRWDLFTHILPSTSLVALANLRLDTGKASKDSFGWLKKGAMNFLVKSAFEIQAGWRFEEKWIGWKLLWKLRVQQ